MFTTFSAGRTRRQENPHASAPHPPKRRSHVHRACDYCRLDRIKCNNERPCDNCLQVNRRCNDDGLNEFSSLASAIKEVERLRTQIKELEETSRLGNKKLDTSGENIPPLTPGRSQGSRSLNEWEPAVEGVIIGDDADDISEYRQMSLHGPLSMAFFLKRMSTFLSVSLPEPHVEMSLHTSHLSFSTDNQLDGATAIPRSQQDYLLDLFWQSYHCLHPIIDEAAFRHQYETLWLNGTSTASGASRQPSPLVDIIMAVSLQLGSSFIGRDENSSAVSERDDAAVAGFAFYQRCHLQLLKTTESPNIVTIQCYIFSVIYLLNASLNTTAQVLTAAAVRATYILGLHQEPASHLSSAEKEIRRRVWWALYLLDSQICIEQGGPWMIPISQSSCRLPDHSLAIAQSCGPNFLSPSQDFTWLSYETHAVRLAHTVRSVHAAFYKHCNKVVRNINAPNFYEDGQAREDCARYLVDCMKGMRSWVQELPESCKTPRRSNGESFSTDRSLLDIDNLSPLWLQRQHFLLELEYHNYSMNLYRSFVCFSPNPATLTPISDSHAISTLNHAIVITNILHQVLTGTEVLHGWYRAFQWLQNAMLTMIGYACAYPVCPPTSSARKAILAAISTLELFSGNFAAAKHAVNLGQDLRRKSEYIIKRFHLSLAGRRPLLPDSDTQQQQQQQQQLVTSPLTAPTPESVQIPPQDNMSMSGNIDTDPSKHGIAGDSLEFLAWVGNDVLSDQNIDDMWSQMPNFNFSADHGKFIETMQQQISMDLNE